MDSPTTPYREGKPLSELIPPDRRRRRTLALIATSMFTGAALWVLGGTLVETVSFAADSTTAVPAAQAKQASVTAAKRSPITVARPSPPWPPGEMLSAANEAALEGRADEVRRLLEPKIRSGHASPQEVRLFKAACRTPFDKECFDGVKALYP